MSELKYHSQRKVFYWVGSYADSALPRDAGFEWLEDAKVWATRNMYRALVLALNGKTKVTGRARETLLPLAQNVIQSSATKPAEGKPLPPAPAGQAYAPYQCAGIQYAAHRAVSYIADEPGLGKTIQAIGIANVNRHQRLFVACPALLRLNWQREIEKWHMGGAPVEVILSKADLKLAYKAGVSVVASYTMLSELDPEVFELLGLEWDLCVVDEAHYLKNAKSLRTQAVLGSPAAPGFIRRAKQAVLLSGTPIENSSIEFHSQLETVCPQVIDNMNYWQFAHRFCKVQTLKFGKRTRKKVYGAKNSAELGMRLRSQIMVRRLKKDVLTDLPEKRYQMIVFPQTSATRRVVKKEEPFNAMEILAAGGVPDDPALPQIRREMGIAKVPDVLEYLDSLLRGVDKVVLGTFHREVAAMYKDKLAAHNPVVLTGDTPPKAKQAAVDRFQNDPACRVFIGQVNAAGVGITLTAASNIVLGEPSWVPGVNSQFVDRVHRVGQNRGVLVHIPVVEGSLDARILSVAAGKQESIDPVLDGVTL